MKQTKGKFQKKFPKKKAYSSVVAVKKEKQVPPAPRPSLKETDIEQFTDFLFLWLGEKEEKVKKQLRAIVEVLRYEKIKKLMEKTSLIDAGEGLLTMDGKRKRTLGGIFFYLCKRHYAYQVRAIFAPLKRQARRKVEKRPGKQKGG